jgi:uncharacterized protein
LNWRSGELAEGLRLYRARNYFEAHEQWEVVWLRSPEPEKTFVQSMIQLAAACYHYQRENRRGTKRLLAAALRRLDANGAVVEANHLVDIRDDLRLWLAALDAPGGGAGEPPESVRRLEGLD